MNELQVNFDVLRVYYIAQFFKTNDCYKLQTILVTENMQSMKLEMAQEQIDRLKLELDEAKNAVRLKEVQLTSKTSIIKNLEQSAEIFKSKLKRMEDKEKDALKNTPQTPTHDFEAQLNSYRQEIQTKNELLYEAKANVSAYVQTVSKLTDEATNLRLKVENAENKVEEKDIEIQRLKQAFADLQKAAKDSAALQKVKDNADIQKVGKDSILSGSLAEIQISQQDKKSQSFNPQVEQSRDEDDLQFSNPHKKMVKELEGYCKGITNLREQIRFLNILSALAENKLDDISESIFNDES